MSSTTAKKRWPAWVYAEGQDPDYRFSFANERTFLAWIRTALALLAASVALEVVDLGISAGLTRTLGWILIALGLLAAIAAWVRWAASERAIRRNAPLPSFGFGLVFTVALTVAAAVLIIAAR